MNLVASETGFEPWGWCPVFPEPSPPMPDGEPEWVEPPEPQLLVDEKSEPKGPFPVECASYNAVPGRSSLLPAAAQWHLGILERRHCVSSSLHFSGGHYGGILLQVGSENSAS